MSQRRIKPPRGRGPIGMDEREKAAQELWQHLVQLSGQQERVGQLWEKAGQLEKASKLYTASAENHTKAVNLMVEKVADLESQYETMFAMENEDEEENVPRIILPE